MTIENILLKILGIWKRRSYTAIDFVIYLICSLLHN